jgi:hypothetical protein
MLQMPVPLFAVAHVALHLSCFNLLQKFRLQNRWLFFNNSACKTTSLFPKSSLLFGNRQSSAKQHFRFLK